MTTFAPGDLVLRRYHLDWLWRVVRVANGTVYAEHPYGPKTFGPPSDFVLAPPDWREPPDPPSVSFINHEPWCKALGINHEHVIQYNLHRKALQQWQHEVQEPLAKALGTEGEPQ